MAKRSKAALNARLRLPNNKRKVRGYCNPHKRLYVQYQGMVITTRPNVAEIMSAVAA